MVLFNVIPNGIAKENCVLIKKTIATLIFATSSTVLAMTADAADSAKIVSIPPTQLQWETTKEGVGFAPLQGNRFKESYMAMVRLPAGLISPAHMKSANMYGLVISGTLTNIAVGADPASAIKLPTGSYYKIPAGLAHISNCVSSIDCVTFLYQDEKFDFLPVGQ